VSRLYLRRFRDPAPGVVAVRNFEPNLQLAQVLASDEALYLQQVALVYTTGAGETATEAILWIRGPETGISWLNATASQYLLDARQGGGVVASEYHLVWQPYSPFPLPFQYSINAKCTKSAGAVAPSIDLMIFGVIGPRRGLSLQ
jgi:hypothetical protein